MVGQPHQLVNLARRIGDMAAKMAHGFKNKLYVARRSEFRQLPEPLGRSLLLFDAGGMSFDATRMPV